MRVRWCVPALVVASVVASVAACGGGSDPGAVPETSSAGATSTVPPEPSPTATTEPWGQQAVAWWDTMGEALSEGVEHLSPFLAPDLLYVDPIGDVRLGGEGAWLDNFADRDELSGVLLPWEDPALFVSADELVGHFVFKFPSPFNDGRMYPIAMPARMEIGPDGVRSWVRAGELAGGRMYEPDRDDYDALDAIADRYVALWNGSPDVEAAALYVDDAVIVDTLLGESLSGRAAIEQVVGTSSWPSIGRMSIAEVPGGDGRAVHLRPSWYEQTAGAVELWLMVDVDDGSGCPGSMAVVLGLDGEQVGWERRYHDVASVRRCFDAAALEPGWWDRIETPDTMVVERTGTVSYGGVEVEVFNGTPGLDRFLEWGFSRYEAAGLPLPRVASVTFLRARVTCLNLGGLASTTEAGASIMLCRSADEVCLDDACQQWDARSRRLWLHELAHPWLNEHTDEATRAAFLELVELPRWADPDDEWGDRGVERAANTLAFGLMDEPVEVVPELHGDCELRDAGFRVLTDTDPITSCAVMANTSSGG